MGCCQEAVRGKMGVTDDYSLPREHPIVHLSSSFDHRLGVEFPGSGPGASSELGSQRVVRNELCRRSRKGADVARGNEDSALSVLDDLGQTADGKGYRREGARQLSAFLKSL